MYVLHVHTCIYMYLHVYTCTYIILCICKYIQHTYYVYVHVPTNIGKYYELDTNDDTHIVLNDLQYGHMYIPIFPR